MKLGILVNSDRHLRHVVGLTRAALAGGHDVLIFTMDAGCRLLADRAYTDLAALPAVTMSVCEQSAKDRGVPLEALPASIVQGSQYHNAVMAHSADRILVL